MLKGKVTRREKEPIMKKEALRILDAGNILYDIDDVDGKMFLMDHAFCGCLGLRFNRDVNETVRGKVVCNGQKIADCFIKRTGSADGPQMLGIPVRGILTEYDKDYVLYVEEFCDTEGDRMEPQAITVHTLACAEPDEKYAAHDAVALQAAREGMVLLKNKDNFLPLPSDTSLLVEGEGNFRITAAGAGRINPRYKIRLGRALKEYSSFRVSEEGEVGLVVISRASGENYDNTACKGEFYLTEEEEETIRRMKEKCSGVVAVINSGYPMDVRFLDEYEIDAAVWCGFGGMEGGRALVEILDGRVNPSGKLPDTWSLDYSEIPASANFYQPDGPEESLSGDAEAYIDTCYQEDIYVGYRYFETFHKQVAFPFGHGLSYTFFQIEGYMEGWAVQAIVTNVGEVPGKEVVQVYVRIPDGVLEQPEKRLVAFEKTKLLRPGESQRIILGFDKKRLASFDCGCASWIMENGEYVFYIGNSVKGLSVCGNINVSETEVLAVSENLMRLPIEMEVLSKKNPTFPMGMRTGIKKGAEKLEPLSVRKKYRDQQAAVNDFVDRLEIWEIARLSVCASHGWGMHKKGEAGKIYALEGYGLPRFSVADGNNGVNVNKPNIGMPSSNLVCATWNRDLAYQIGKVIAEEAKENDIQLLLAPAVNIHRNPLCGRHPEYFSEDPYLAGVMAGFHCKGIEENGVAGCLKHLVANNCESARKRNHSLITERALREIYLKVFEIAFEIHKPSSVMTAYNACNGCYTAEDEELLQGILRGEFGFEGFVMTDWNSYETADVAAAVGAGNCWITPGSVDDTYVNMILKGVKEGTIQVERLRWNVRFLLRIVQKYTGTDLGVK